MKRNIALDLLRTIACMLILNFHLEPLFPDKLKILSIGGDIGNNLFFMLSGYLLYKRINETEICEFKTYYLSRIKNLLPQTLIILAGSILVGSLRFTSIKDLITFLIFPAHFWFVLYIIYFYIFVFFQIKCFSKKTNIIICVFLLLLHLCLNGVSSERYIIGYISMLYGYYLNESQITINNGSLKLSLFGVLYVGLKLIYKLLLPGSRIIHLLIGISIILMSSIAIKITKDNEKLKNFISSKKFVYKLISIISSCTLEVYLISFFNNWYIIRKTGELFIFPLSYFISIIVIVTISYFFHRIVVKK